MNTDRRQFIVATAAASLGLALPTVSFAEPPDSVARILQGTLQMEKHDGIILLFWWTRSKNELHWEATVPTRRLNAAVLSDEAKAKALADGHLRYGSFVVYDASEIGMGEATHESIREGLSLLKEQAWLTLDHVTDSDVNHFKEVEKKIIDKWGLEEAARLGIKAYVFTPLA